MKFHPDATFQPAPDVVFRELDNEAVVLHLGSATYFGLDEVGTRVWLLLTEGRSLKAICEALAEEFVALPGEIDRDVRALVDELVQKDLLHVGG